MFDTDPLWSWRLEDEMSSMKSGLRLVGAAGPGGATRGSIMMQATPLRECDRQRLFGEPQAVPQAGAPAGVGRRPVSLVGPLARPQLRGRPGGRPVQPPAPSVKHLMRPAVATAVLVTPRPRHSGSGWELTDRGLLVVMIAFVLALVLGAAAVVGVFVSVGNASLSGAEAGQVVTKVR